MKKKPKMTFFKIRFGSDLVEPLSITSTESWHYPTNISLPIAISNFVKFGIFWVFGRAMDGSWCLCVLLGPLLGFEIYCDVVGFFVRLIVSEVMCFFVYRNSSFPTFLPTLFVSQFVQVRTLPFSVWTIKSVGHPSKIGLLVVEWISVNVIDTIEVGGGRVVTEGSSNNAMYEVWSYMRSITTTVKIIIFWAVILIRN